jgi:hypothetical protein
MALAAVPFAAGLVLFLAYNRAQTGDAFLQPFQKYSSTDAPSIPRTAAEWSGRAGSHLVERLWDLNLWLPMSVLFLSLALGIRATRADPRVRVCILSVAALVAAFFFYWGPGLVQYGPRYLYEAVGILLVVSAALIASFGRAGAILALGCLILNGTHFVQASRSFSEEIRGKRDYLLAVREKGLSNAIVFLGSGSGNAPVLDLPRNGIDFDGPVLFVRDLGARNRQLIRHYPERKAYYYEYDPRREKGRVVPYEEARLDR